MQNIRKNGFYVNLVCFDMQPEYHYQKQQKKLAKVKFGIIFWFSEQKKKNKLAASRNGKVTLNLYQMQIHQLGGHKRHHLKNTGSGDIIPESCPQMRQRHIQSMFK